MNDCMIYKNPSYTPQERAEDLLSRMTLREKIAQLDMKFGNNYCTEKDPNHSCSVTPTSDYDWEKLKTDFPDGLGYLHDNYSVPSVKFSALKRRIFFDALLRNSLRRRVKLRICLYGGSLLLTSFTTSLKSFCRSSSV